MFRGTQEAKVYAKMEEVTSTPQMKLAAQTLAIAKSDVKAALEKYLKSIDAHEAYPDDVNAVKPHHVRVIGAMGDSLTVSTCRKNRNVGDYANEMRSSELLL
uniref:Uncharacterized protein n=2 Tax=Caenorhabditis japonica TaxID=281687 RepID=A0A8R1DIM6_CAEJA